jgi:hypothetical protein
VQGRTRNVKRNVSWDLNMNEDLRFILNPGVNTFRSVAQNHEPIGKFCSMDQSNEMIITFCSMDALTLRIEQIHGFENMEVSTGPRTKNTKQTHLIQEAKNIKQTLSIL